MPWLRKSAQPFRSFADIAPRGLVDLHAHLLPGVDDGPGDIEESAAMIDGLLALGYQVVTATPHLDPAAGTPNLERLKALTGALEKARNNPVPQIRISAEIGLDERFMDREAAGALPAIGLGRVYLVEVGFHPGSLAPGLEETIFRCTIQGVRLVLAHPERVPDVQRKPERLFGLARAGLLLQVDVLSLTGRYGRTAKTAALALLDQGLADLVASDLHRADELSDLGRGLALLADRGSDEFVRLAQDNPRALLEAGAAALVRHV